MFIFSLEGVLASKSPFEFLAQTFGFENEIMKFEADIHSRDVPWMERVIRQSLFLTGLPVTDMAAALGDMPVRRRLLDFICERPDHVAVTSDLPDVLVDCLAARFGCRFFSAAASVTDGRFVKMTQLVKRQQAVTWAQGKGGQAVYIGADDASAEAMSVADVAIAVDLHGQSGMPGNAAFSMADYIIFDEETLCRQMFRLC